MDQTTILILSALSIGFIHTLVGPDHYVPFIALSRSRGWSMRKTIAVTTACGLGHILSGALLGLAATSIGFILDRLDIIESIRGRVAAWLLVGFGLVYCIWGIRGAIRNKSHSHPHSHTDGILHTHRVGHAHTHSGQTATELTPWVLFIIFIFGPCEPLIPLILYPAVQDSVGHVIAVTAAFGLSTLAAMITVVTASSFGMKRLALFPFMERFGNALAGGLICSCGLGMAFLGL